MATIAQKLDQGRQSLLDLSTRNRLLSIPKRTSSKLINVYDEKSAEAYRVLVTDNKSMTFLPGKKGTSEIAEEDATDDEAGVFLPQPEEEESSNATRHSDTKLQTKLASDKLQHRLLEMFYDAKTFVEEQGVNILYLALGQLRWYDKNAPDKERLAPIVLLPVSLSRKSAAERFHLTWLQEDAAENLSLAAKLKADFGLLMPEFKGGDDFDLPAYMQQVGAVVSNQNKWAVLPDAIVLGFFSFSKFLMYRDLDPAVWPEPKAIDRQPLICASLQDGFPAKDEIFPEFVHIDKLVPVDTQRHVVDSDSSQTLAIEAVRRGENLVIQGPPGTGKSQTITNVIAAAVADGKSVLFVSEKMAALEVVHRRLSSIGLAPACLELHSNRSNKRRVLEELKATKELGRPRLAQRDEVVGELKALQDYLNTHAEMMHASFAPHQLHAYEVIGHLARLGAVSLTNHPNLAPDCQKWSPEEFALRKQAVLELAQKSEKVGRATTHVWRGVGHKAILKLDADKWLANAVALAASLQALVERSAALAASLTRQPGTTLQAVQEQIDMARKIATAPPLDRASIASAAWNTGFRSLAELVESGQKFAASRARLQPKFVESAWTDPMDEARRCIAARGDSLFRIFSGEYRQAMRTVKAQLKEPLPPTLGARVALLDELLKSISLRKQLHTQHGLGMEAFGSMWNGEASDWAQLKAIVDWTAASKEAAMPAQFRELYAKLPAPDACGTAADACAAAAQQFASQADLVVQSFQLDLREAFGVAELKDVALGALVDRLAQWVAQPSGLFDWVHYFAARERVAELGLPALVQELERGTFDRIQLVALTGRAYYESVFRDLCALLPALVEFDGEQHSRRVEQFKALDKKRIDIARAETALRHFEQIPRSAGGIGPMGVLNGEIARKRGHMPLRRLFRQAAEAVQAIKPVFMMSPLSVAQFLEPGGIEFDLLVIDEASQIEPVDALGAVARCKQMVVVGDDRQLPPTRFFSRMTSEVEVNDEDDEAHAAGAGDVESILSLCVAKGMPQMMLRWHYRSRHQSLIAVSNQQFYKNQLFIVPSPSTAESGMGLKFNHVANGVFDTGGTRVNREEARTIARAIIAHAKAHPKLSLGVASFSLQQKIAIQDELELLRRQHPEAEAFFADHPTEPFFIKNLENVQGDERDVIFISVAYARDPSGYLPMRFGPVGADGGERRLNVLISRAKLRCEVFSSITSDDIDLERALGKGVAALKVFLRYAETGKLSLANRTDHEIGSELEDEVKKALEQEGLAVHQQVGEAGFFIDLAILDQDLPGRYLLGIEFDGDSYHSARSARDRDRLRQAVLEDHGWYLHRIWASDWFRQPEQEVRKVVAAVQVAKQELAASQEQRRAAERQRALQVTFVDREHETEVHANFADVEGEPYAEAAFEVPRHKEIHDMPAYRLAELTHKVLLVEGPIHEDEVVTRIRTLWGLQRAGNRIRDAVGESIRLLERDRSALRSGPFLDVPSRPVRVRSRSAVASQALRKPEYLPPVEIQAAIKSVLERNLGGRKEEIPSAVAKALGLSVVTTQLREAVDLQIEHLHQNADVELRGDIYKLRAG